MNLFRKIFLSAFIAIAAFAGPASSAEISKADQDKIIKNFRKSLSVMPNWDIQIKEVKDSPFPSLYQAAMEFRTGDMVRTQNILISTDSKQYIVGNVFRTDEDLDAARLSKLRPNRGPSKGKADAPVTIVEFSDLECGSCKNAHDLMKQDKLLDQYAGKVRFVYKNLPFSRPHPWAMSAAVACMCAYHQNHAAFWKMQDQIFIHQSSITVSNLWSNLSLFAKSSGIDPVKFKNCFDKNETLDFINADIAEAEAVGVTQTPTFFVNGRMVVGYPGAPNFKLLIDEFLKKN